MHDKAALIRAGHAAVDQRRPLASCLLLLAVVFVLLPGCTEDPAVARARGWKAGFEAGYRDGEREGYEQGFRNAFGASFDRKADEAPQGREILRDPVRLVVFVLVFLLLGFGAQYSALYLLRRAHLLRDVDSILLGSRNASLTLKSLNPEQAMNSLLPDEQGGGDRDGA